MKRLCLLVVSLVLVLRPSAAQALVLINEILADPASGLAGDANNDGTRSTSDDEFVELFNAGPDVVDLSGWIIADAAKDRHVFDDGSSLTGGEALVVFGGGSPSLSGVQWDLASSGSLSLNNTSDTVILYDSLGQIMDQIVYGSEGGKDQALVRSPEGEGTDWVLHGDLAGTDLAFSPGVLIQPPQFAQEEGETDPVVPEAATLLSFGMGITMMLAGVRRV